VLNFSEKKLTISKVYHTKAHFFPLAPPAFLEAAAAGTFF
jgi:hypothetical protein